jgi:hypothetical protein
VISADTSIGVDPSGRDNATLSPLLEGAESEVRAAKQRLRIRSNSASPSHANTWLWSLGQATSGDADLGVGN